MKYTMTRWRDLLGAILLVPVILSICSVPAQAQNAQIIGVVFDETGGVMPGVTMTARNQETGLARTILTDDAGAYRLLRRPQHQVQLFRALTRPRDPTSSS